MSVWNLLLPKRKRRVQSFRVDRQPSPIVRRKRSELASSSSSIPNSLQSSAVSDWLDSEMGGGSRGGRSGAETPKAPEAKMEDLDVETGVIPASAPAPSICPFTQSSSCASPRSTLSLEPQPLKSPATPKAEPKSAKASELKVEAAKVVAEVPTAVVSPVRDEPCTAVVVKAAVTAAVTAATAAAAATTEPQHHDYKDTLSNAFDLGGMDCHADDREALREFERFFNNSAFSDVTLLVGEEIFYAHRLVLIKASEVFERMLSQQWSGDSKVRAPDASARAAVQQVELVEDRVCAKVFPAFLRFLYCNHIVLHSDNTLPVLILADKYNVVSLRKVCIQYAVNHIIPSLSLKDIFHIWFQYGTKCFHQELINVCIGTLAVSCQELVGSPEWDKDWLSMDREQLNEFLKSSELNIRSEFELWEAVARWVAAPSHPERRGAFAEKTLAHIVPLIRFPFMSPDELSMLEASPLAAQFPKIFQPHIMAAYKFNALPLASRVACREFTGLQHLLRNYGDLRWDKRILIPDVSSMLKYTEYTVKLTTRASAIPPQNWDWELKIHPKGFSSSQEDFRCILSSNVILDQTRSVEYLLSIVSDSKILRSISGKKSFSKTRYSADLEMEKRVGLEELCGETAPLLCDDALMLQLTLKPIMD